MTSEPCITRRMWWELFIALAAACVAWALTAPPLGGPDESAHAIRAAAVARGQLMGKPTESGSRNVVSVTVRVPQVFEHAAETQCFAVGRKATPACAPTLQGGSHLIDAATDEHRSLPPYYAVVGLPTLVWPSANGLYVMRVVSALLCAAFLTSAFVSVLELSSPTVAVLGVVVAMAPEVPFLAGLVNSNSIEIAAAICLWASLITIARMPRRPSTRLVVRCSAAAVALMLSRGLSLAFAAIIVLTAAALTDRRRIGHLAARRDVRWCAVVVGSAAAAVVGWLVYLQVDFPLDRVGIGLSEAIPRTSVYLRQAVGVFNERVAGVFDIHDLPLPWIVYAAWAVAAVALFLGALLFASRRDAAVVIALSAVALVLPVTATGLNVPPIGLPWQGRYGLPLLTGIAIVAAGVIALPESFARRVGVWRVALPVGVLTACHIVGFASAVRRFGVSDVGTHNPLSYLFSPRWTPSTGPLALYFFCFAAAISAAGVLVTRWSWMLERPAEPASHSAPRADPVVVRTSPAT